MEKHLWNRLSSPSIWCLLFIEKIKENQFKKNFRCFICRLLQASKQNKDTESKICSAAGYKILFLIKPPAKVIALLVATPCYCVLCMLNVVFLKIWGMKHNSNKNKIYKKSKWKIKKNVYELQQSHH